MPQKSMTATEIVARLIEWSIGIDRRAGSLKPAEEKRVDNALRIMASTNAGKLDPYRHFLHQVHKKIGQFTVILVAASGPTAILALKDHAREEVLGQLFEQEATIPKQHLDAIWSTYANKYLRRSGQTSILYTVDLASFLVQYKDKTLK
ncbi:hypothetical protein CDD83_87 [Cordyceps sp. RAO-2017]|nr:hypothetical protein CDD83_87 [Cordyceps sp. RAO-2017]